MFLRLPAKIVGFCYKHMLGKSLTLCRERITHWPEQPDICLFRECCLYVAKLVNVLSFGSKRVWLAMFPLLVKAPAVRPAATEEINPSKYKFTASPDISAADMNQEENPNVLNQSASSHRSRRNAAREYDSEREKIVGRCRWTRNF